MEQEEKNIIRRKAVSGAMWKFAERILAQLVSVVVTIVLARILMPEDYGTVAIVSIFFAFCNVIISGGLNSALVQKKEVNELDYATVMIASLVLAALLYVVVFFSAPYISSIYGKPILVPMFRVMALTFFINSYKAVVCAYVSRNLDFKKFFYSTLSGTVASGVVGIAMAKAGFGPWALAAQQMTNALVDSAVLTIATRFRVRLAFSWMCFKPLFGYGWKILVASIITVIYDEIKPLIIGLRYSGKDLAFYSNGRQYPALLNTSISATLSAVTFPVISKFQNDVPSVRNAIRRYMKTSSYVIFPLLIGFLAVADNFVSLLLTDKWLPAVPFARVFCCCYLFDLVQIGNLQAIKAIGRSDLVLKLEIIKKTIYFFIILCFVMFTHSPLMLAASEILCAICACVINAYPNRRLMQYGYRNQFLDLLPNFAIAVVMGICVMLLGKFWAANNALLLCLQVVLGVGLYVLLSALTRNESYVYIKEMIHTSLLKNNKS